MMFCRQRGGTGLMCIGSADRVAPLRSIIHTAHDAPSLPSVISMDVK